MIERRYKLIKYYEDELIQISEGIPPREVLSQVEIKSLVKKGILRIFRTGRSGTNIVITKKSKSLLGK